MYLINWEMCVLLYIGVVVDVPYIRERYVYYCTYVLLLMYLIYWERCVLLYIFVVVDVSYIMGEMSTIVHRCCCGCK